MDDENVMLRAARLKTKTPGEAARGFRSGRFGRGVSVPLARRRPAAGRWTFGGFFERDETILVAVEVREMFRRSIEFRGGNLAVVVLIQPLDEALWSAAWRPSLFARSAGDLRGRICFRRGMPLRASFGGFGRFQETVFILIELREVFGWAVEFRGRNPLILIGIEARHPLFSGKDLGLSGFFLRQYRGSAPQKSSQQTSRQDVPVHRISIRGDAGENHPAEKEYGGRG